MIQISLDKKKEIIDEIIKTTDNKNFDIHDVEQLLINKNHKELTNYNKNDNKKNLEFIKLKWKKYLLNIHSKTKKPILNFYIHMPYCETKCLYCRESSKDICDGYDEENYVRFIINYLEEFKTLFSKVKFNSFYFGGGTPSLLTGKSIDNILIKVFQNYKFEDDAEKTFESNPRSLTPKKLDILKKNGINRISLGVQSTNKTILKTVGRVYIEYNKLKELFYEIKKRDFQITNIDLILGLKGETKKSFITSFKKICELNPSRIQIYPLNPTKKYLELFYSIKEEKIFSELKKLIGEIKEEIIEIGNNYQYNLLGEIDSKNMIGFAFHKFDYKRFKHRYEFIMEKPSSCFGVGKKAESRIYSMLSYEINSSENDINKLDYLFNINFRN